MARQATGRIAVETSRLRTKGTGVAGEVVTGVAGDAICGGGGVAYLAAGLCAGKAGPAGEVVAALALDAGGIAGAEYAARQIGLAQQTALGSPVEVVPTCAVQTHGHVGALLATRQGRRAQRTNPAREIVPTGAVLAGGGRVAEETTG